MRLRIIVAIPFCLVAPTLEDTISRYSLRSFGISFGLNWFTLILILPQISTQKKASTLVLVSLAYPKTLCFLIDHATHRRFSYLLLLIYSCFPSISSFSFSLSDLDSPNKSYSGPSFGPLSKKQDKSASSNQNS